MRKFTLLVVEPGAIMKALREALGRRLARQADTLASQGSGPIMKGVIQVQKDDVDHQGHKTGLDFIPKLIEDDGQLPEEYLPRGPAVGLATRYLKERFLPKDETDIVRNAERIESRLEFKDFVSSVALEIHPYLTPSHPAKNEIRFLCEHILHDVAATPDGASAEVFEKNKREIYLRLSRCQLWLLDRLLEPTSVDDMPVGSITREAARTAYHILDGVLLRIAVQMEAWGRLQTLARQERPARALDYLLGRIERHDWFLASEMRRATNYGKEDIMECLRTGRRPRNIS